MSIYSNNNINRREFYLPDDDGDDVDGRSVGDRTHLCSHAHSFVPPDVDVEMVWLIESSYPNRLNRLLH